MIGTRKTHGRDRRPRRVGFTLVEMLVVIVIITLLAALVTPAIFGAMARAKEARIAVDIAGLSQALERYKQEVGEYPPDFAVPLSNLGGPEHWQAVNERINQHLQRVYRFRKAMNPGDAADANNPPDLPRMLDQNGNNIFEDNELKLLANLDPAEAIVFWLQGFSSDKQRPIFGRTAQIAGAGLSPYFGFDKSRLSDVDGDGFPEDYPKGLDEAPYIYYRSYRPPGYFGNLYYSHVAAWHQDVDAGKITAAVAIESLGKHMPNPYFSASAGTDLYAELDQYQLISSGLDGDYGVGGGVDDAGNPYGVFPSGPYSQGDEDNITNFSEGTLEDALP